ncbi:MAG: phosphatidate cytidylyltransferase [Verrucomicrobiaceae bacterium]
MAKTTTPQSKGAVFRARLTSTLVIWAIVTGVFVSGNPWAFFGLIAFLTVTGAGEFRGMFKGQGGDGCRVIGLVVGLLVALRIGYGLVGQGWERPGFDGEMLGMVIVLLGAFVWRFRNGIEGRQSVDAVGDALLAYLYVPVLFGAFMLRLCFLPEVDAAVPGAWLILMMCASAKFTDMGAYISGSLFGKHKMAPHLSPAKTWEGFFGAHLFAQAGAWGVWALAGEALAWIPPLHVGVLGVLMALSAVAGDLAESILKRSLAVKDSGSWMPGIGGILDLIDSLCFAAPVMYFYLILTGLI